jgi:o-succinylbenzoate synthase
MTKFSYACKKFILQFKKAAGTSRGILLDKPSWLIYITDEDPGITGIGEYSIIPNLSPDEKVLDEEAIPGIVKRLNEGAKLEDVLTKQMPALHFAFETALLDMQAGGKKVLFDNAFSRGEEGILINGLIWMGPEEDMLKQALRKVEEGYSCLKLKVGALDFDAEVDLLKKIRQQIGDSFEIRLDANGAFHPQEALKKLNILARFNIHSIEQPIRAGQREEMRNLCKKSPVPIVLDEELIGIHTGEEKRQMLEEIQPEYIILKPSLTGGFAQSDEWIGLAESMNIGWWATSALEGNIGLNAIAQWVAGKPLNMPQGLGTGSLYVTNFPMPLSIRNGFLWQKPPDL